MLLFLTVDTFSWGDYTTDNVLLQDETAEKKKKKLLGKLAKHTRRLENI